MGLVMAIIAKKNAYYRYLQATAGGGSAWNRVGFVYYPSSLYQVYVYRSVCIGVCEGMFILLYILWWLLVYECGECGERVLCAP